MRASAIRHLAITDESSIVAAALFEKTVQIWSWKDGKQLGEFETILDFGGHRFALTPDGRICFAAGWGRGLAAYSVPEGRLLWRRRDIHKPQTVRLGGSGRELYCGVDSSSAHILDVYTGESLGRMRGAIDIFVSQYTPHRLIEKKKRYAVGGGSEFEVKANSFALLDVAFSPDKVCLSENTGGTRLIDLATGKLLWHLDLATNHLAFNSSDQRFYCCVGVEGAPSQNRSLIRLASSLPECDQVVALGQCWEEAFTPSGEVLVTVEGNVYETSTGNLLARLNFPTRDYPDA